MTIHTFLAEATATLRQAGIPSARLDSIIVLEDALQLDRAHILAHPEHKLTAAQVALLRTAITRRVEHIPLAYIRGSVPFYGRNFIVTDAVLVPRPETEDMITLLKNLPLPAAPSIADIGTGSGCIGITAQLELPDARIYLYDIDGAALAVAAQNAAALNAAVHISQADLLHSVTGSFDVLLANLPYVPDTYPVNDAARHEPSLALYGGQDGLDLYRNFWEQVRQLPQKPLFVLTEALPAQHHAVTQLAHTAGFTLTVRQSFIQQFKRR